MCSRQLFVVIAQLMTDCSFGQGFELATWDRPRRVISWKPGQVNVARSRLDTGKLFFFWTEGRKNIVNQ